MLMRNPGKPKKRFAGWFSVVVATTLLVLFVSPSETWADTAAKPVGHSLPAGLTSENWSEREQAIKQVVKDGNTRAMGKLAKMSRQDPHPKVRQAAAWAVGEMDLKMRKSVLQAIISQDESPEVKTEAELALSKLEEKYEKPSPSPVNESVGGCQKDTDCKGERICTAPLRVTNGWAREAGIFGFLGTATVGGLSLAAALNKEHLVPAIPLAASGTAVTVISSTIIRAGSNSAKTTPQVTGLVGLRLAGWLSFGFHITGSLVLACAVPFHWLKEDEEGNKWTPPTAWIIANGGLGMIALFCLSLESIIAGNQATTLAEENDVKHKAQAAFNIAPTAAPFFGQDGSAGAILGAVGTF